MFNSIFKCSSSPSCIWNVFTGPDRVCFIPQPSCFNFHICLRVNVVSSSPAYLSPGGGGSSFRRDALSPATSIRRVNHVEEMTDFGFLKGSTVVQREWAEHFFNKLEVKYYRDHRLYWMTHLLAEVSF